MNSDPDFPDSRHHITGEQCIRSRRLLGLTQQALARAAGVSTDTISRFENGGGSRSPNRAKLRGVLEAAGVEFTNGGEPGVKLRK
jgi:transcriptional regulator with XRE-family HTH domain